MSHCHDYLYNYNNIIILIFVQSDGLEVGMILQCDFRSIQHAVTLILVRQIKRWGVFLGMMCHKLLPWRFVYG